MFSSFIILENNKGDENKQIDLKRKRYVFTFFTNVVFSFVQTQNDLETVDHDKSFYFLNWNGSCNSRFLSLIDIPPQLEKDKIKHSTVFMFFIDLVTYMALNIDVTPLHSHSTSTPLKPYLG